MVSSFDCTSCADGYLQFQSSAPCNYDSGDGSVGVKCVYFYCTTPGSGALSPGCPKAGVRVSPTTHLFIESDTVVVTPVWCSYSFSAAAHLPHCKIRAPPSLRLPSTRLRACSLTLSAFACATGGGLVAILMTYLVIIIIFAVVLPCGSWIVAYCCCVKPKQEQGYEMQGASWAIACGLFWCGMVCSGVWCVCALPSTEWWSWCSSPAFCACTVVCVCVVFCLPCVSVCAMMQWPGRYTQLVCASWMFRWPDSQPAGRACRACHAGAASSSRSSCTTTKRVGSGLLARATTAR